MEIDASNVLWNTILSKAHVTSPQAIGLYPRRWAYAHVQNLVRIRQLSRLPATSVGSFQRAALRISLPGTV